VPAATDQQVVALLPALEDAARADPNAGPIKFVPPRIGILEQTAAKRHLFVFGRRGVGKSTLLRKLQQDSDEFKSEVLFIDVETLRGRPYPDVLIELLIALLGQLDEGLRDAANARGNRAKVANFGVRRRVRRLRRTLEVLLAEPQEATRSVRRLRQTERSGAAGAVVPPIKGVWAWMRAKTSSRTESTEEAEFTATKMEGLNAAVVRIRAVLNDATGHVDGKPTLVVLDDFYHVTFEDQPQVLAYLHQIVKNLPIYLKICGVRHRINDFVEGHPPTGLQIGHDAGDVSLDITLEQFSAAQQFLENVLGQVCEVSDVTVQDLVTETGRERLVLGSGGVARDYLDLVSKAFGTRTSGQRAPTDRTTASPLRTSTRSPPSF